MRRLSESRRVAVATCLWAALSFGASAGAPEASAQEASTLVDRIVALVADTAVLQSELQEFVFRLQAQGARLPRGRNELREFFRQALEQKVNEVLLFVHAKREGVIVAESEVNDLVDERLAQIKRQFPSELEYERALATQATTPAEFRIRLTEQVRTELTTQRFLQQTVSEQQPLPVSDEEIRARFEAQKAALGVKPATVTLKQVVIPPRPSEDARLLAQERAEQALSRARSGEDFAKLAREYSDDVGSRSEGGLLNWVRRGQLLPEFEEALFSMRAGAISELVETSVGLHVIKLERIRGNERFARHILIRPEISDEDLVQAEQLAEEVAAALRSGADVDSLITRHGDTGERSSLSDFPQDRLPEEYRQRIQGAQEDEVLGPFLLPAPGVAGGGKWIVARLLELRAGGEWTFADVKETLRTQIQQEQMLQRVVDDLRKATFTEVRAEAIDTLIDQYVEQGVVGR